VPFYLVSHAHEATEVMVDRGTGAVQWDVAQSIRQRVAVLSETAQLILTAAAIVGRSVDLVLLE
jgi:hypothetical protein